MKFLKTATARLLLGILVVSVCPVATEANQTTIRAVVGGDPAPNVNVRVTSTISGQTVFEGTTDDQGILIVRDLDEDMHYQVQTDDGHAWSESFEGGTNVIFDTGIERPGWDLYFALNSRVGNANAEFKTSDDSRGVTSSVGVSLGTSVGVRAPPFFVYNHPIRPIIETGLEFPLTHSPSIHDDQDNDGRLRTTIRWQTGLGVSSPFRLWTKEYSADAVVAYVLSNSKFTTKLVGLEESSDRYIGHALELQLRASVPLYEFAGIVFGLTAGAAVRVPLAGKAVNDAGVESREEPAYRGLLGIRISMPNRFGTSSRPPLR